MSNTINETVVKKTNFEYFIAKLERESMRVVSFDGWDSGRGTTLLNRESPNSPNFRHIYSPRQREFSQWKEVSSLVGKCQGYLAYLGRGRHPTIYNPCGISR